MSGCGAPSHRRLQWAVFLYLIGPAIAVAHWTRPEDIVVGLATDAQLRDRVGVVSVEQQAELPRLLVIKVRRDRWQSLTPAQRKQLAEEWWENWRHNVPEGIVAVLDASSEQSVVNFDGVGQARLVTDTTMPTPSQ